MGGRNRQKSSVLVGPRERGVGLVVQIALQPGNLRPAFCCCGVVVVEHFIEPGLVGVSVRIDRELRERRLEAGRVLIRHPGAVRVRFILMHSGEGVAKEFQRQLQRGCNDVVVREHGDVGHRRRQGERCGKDWALHGPAECGEGPERGHCVESHSLLDVVQSRVPQLVPHDRSDLGIGHGLRGATVTPHAAQRTALLDIHPAQQATHAPD
mmetsp:Transcript_34514/g.95041  ORF Transcript_34514/g.95041 Transcript_34514/m.95041 type:complete len:210 (-) Transcript_34514:1434-2063(-)